MYCIRHFRNSGFQNPTLHQTFSKQRIPKSYSPNPIHCVNRQPLHQPENTKTAQWSALTAEVLVAREIFRTFWAGYAA
jgi:hypothetical protein